MFISLIFSPHPLKNAFFKCFSYNNVEILQKWRWCKKENGESELDSPPLYLFFTLFVFSPSGGNSSAQLH